MGAAAAGAVALDAAAVAAAQFLLPQLPFFTILLPLIIANILVFVAVVLYERRRRGPSSMMPFLPRTRLAVPSLPVPRVATLTTPLKPQQPLINPTKAQGEGYSTNRTHGFSASIAQDRRECVR